MENSKNRFLYATAVLPYELRAVLKNAPDFIINNALEVILRTNKPLCIECVNKRYYFTKSGCITDSILSSDMLICTSKTLFETFQSICNFSVYSKQSEINSGYITINGGHRVGISGTCVLNNNKIVNIKDITTLNIRIAREIIGCSDELRNSINPLNGVLLCGAPCSGKTTLIRDLARTLSLEYKVTVVDERNELASSVSGVAQNDLGLCDIFNSYLKDDAITHSVRSMSPDIIVCDEISTIRDLSTIENSVNCGVSFIATIHSDGIEKMLSRKSVRELLKTRAFNQIVFLDNKHNIGKIKSIVNLSEIESDLIA